MRNNREYICLCYDLIGNGYFPKLTFVVIIYLSCFLISQVSGSIHDYQNQSFIRRSNSFFFHGGSEGLYASKLYIDPDKKDSSSSSSSPEDNHLSGKSFIRSSLRFFFSSLFFFCFSSIKVFPFLWSVFVSKFHIFLLYFLIRKWCTIGFIIWFWTMLFISSIFVGFLFLFSFWAIFSRGFFFFLDSS